MRRNPYPRWLGAGGPTDRPKQQKTRTRLGAAGLPSIKASPTPIESPESARKGESWDGLDQDGSTAIGCKQGESLRLPSHPVRMNRPGCVVCVWKGDVNDLLPTLFHRRLQQHRALPGVRG